MTKRRGAILISLVDYLHNTSKVQLIYSNILPYRVEQRFDFDGFEVLAVSEAFEPIEDGLSAPLYEAEFWEEEGNTFVKFRKVEK